MLQWVLSTLNAAIPIAISTAKENAGNGGQNRIIPPIELIEPLGPSGGSAWSSGQTILNLGDSLIFAASQDAFVPFKRHIEFPSDHHHDTLVPATVLEFTERGSHISASWLQATVDDYLRRDDVLNPSFLVTIIINANTQTLLSVDAKAEEWLSSHNAAIYSIQTSDPVKLLPGPYFIARGGLYRALKLYPDVQEAFVSTGLVSSEYTTKPGLFGRYIPVPSRLHALPSTDAPLAGLRVGVKDVIDVAGYPTGASNRAFKSFYPVKNVSAPVVRRLIELGAVVVGKTKSTQFALGEEPTADWVDEFCPFNPRGDGYQTTEGSSAGSGAAMAAYDWLDLALGTDTTGSVRLPAAFQGIFGFRPTTGIISNQGVIPVSSVYDTVGLLARSIETIHQAMNSLKGEKAPPTLQMPTTLLYPEDYFPFPEPHAQQALEAFVSQLETHLNLKRKAINLNALWLKQNPSGTGLSLESYLNTTVSDILTSDSYHAHAGFVKEYHQVHGRHPFISPLVRWTWEFGSGISAASRAESVKRKGVYKNWVHETILKTTEDGWPESILVFPFGDPAPRYRDTYRDPPSYAGFSWRSDFQSPLAELPDLVVPVGQYPYESRITKTVEHLPVSIAIISAQGTDLKLLAVMEDFLVHSGKSTVKTGRYPFDVHAKGPGLKHQL